jgi:hypothetical protein
MQQAPTSALGAAHVSKVRDFSRKNTLRHGGHEFAFVEIIRKFRICGVCFQLLSIILCEICQTDILHSTPPRYD